MRTIIGMMLVSLGLVGCGSGEQTTLTRMPTNLGGIQQLNQAEVRSLVGQDKGHFRKEMLQETALSVGARSGLAYRANEINRMLKTRAAYLDEIFDFRALVLTDNILPPVLVESRGALNLETPHTIRVADRQYRIVKQARFVTAAPVWQDYLIFKVSPPELPDASLLPKEDSEREQLLWARYTTKGWRQGIQQADQIYAENLNRMKRDYQGMVRYRILLAQNMISAPQVAQRELGITGGGEEMAVNDRIITIESLPALKADTTQWQAAVK